MAERIVIVEYDAAWPAEFERLRDHLYVSPADSQELHAQLAFRDRLHVDPALAAQYEALKRELAAQYGNDRNGYTNAKGSFVTAATGL